MLIPRLSRAASGASVLAGLLGLSTPFCETTTTEGEPLVLEITAPAPGTLESGYEPDCPISVEVEGTAAVGTGRFDLVFVLDSSGSSGNCTGSDVDGDGIIGIPVIGPLGSQECSDPGDSILSAEVTAVANFVEELSPARSRVSIVQFSNPEGTLGFGSRQRIVQPLTDDYSLVDAALGEVLAGGSAGATDYGGGMRLARMELALNGEPGRDPVVYFMSDGIPTYPEAPFNLENPADSQSAIDEVDLASAAGAVVNSFGIGFVPGPSLDPVVPARCLVDSGSGPMLVSTLECMAARTGGSFLASSDPSEILEALRLTRPIGIESITLFNDTTGDFTEATLTPDGTYGGFLPALLGETNELRVVAVTDDGTTCEATSDFTTLCFAPGCTPRTQGYWHRQCLGVGLTIPGLRDRARGGPSVHPDWDEDILLLLLESIRPDLERLGVTPEENPCVALEADPPREPCQRAIKQFAALLLNRAGGNLSPDCIVSLDDVGGLDGDFTLDEIVEELVALIQAGLAGDPSACQRAAAIADAINTGDAL